MNNLRLETIRKYPETVLRTVDHGVVFVCPKCEMEKPNPPETPKGLSKQWVLNAQWTDCPIEVQKEVKLLWRLHENGNDRYIIRTSVGDLEETNHDTDNLVDTFDEVEGKRKMVPVTTTAILQYLAENGITNPEEEIIIYY